MLSECRFLSRLPRRLLGLRLYLQEAADVGQSVSAGRGIRFANAGRFCQYFSWSRSVATMDRALLCFCVILTAGLQGTSRTFYCCHGGGFQGCAKNVRMFFFLNFRKLWQNITVVMSNIPKILILSVKNSHILKTFFWKWYHYSLSVQDQRNF